MLTQNIAKMKPNKRVRGMNYTEESKAKLAAYLDGRILAAGVGSEQAPCALAAINLAMTGELKDEIPECMSFVLGKATIVLQDAMPYRVRNSERFKALLIDMPGTGRECEEERLSVLLEWMWQTVLPEMQGLADSQGFGDEWRKMLEERMHSDIPLGEEGIFYVALCVERACRFACKGAENAKLGQRGFYTAIEAYASAAIAACNTVPIADKFAESDGFQTRVDVIGVLKRMTYLGGE